jgi:hypothetical protein
MRDPPSRADPPNVTTTDASERFTTLPDEQTPAATVIALEEHEASGGVLQTFIEDVAPHVRERVATERTT